MKKLNLLIFRDCESWVAQCLEHDIAAQASSLNDVQYEIQRVLFGRICVGKRLGIDPFEGVPPAPPSFQKIFNDQIDTFRLELKPFADLGGEVPFGFELPKEALLYA